MYEQEKIRPYAPKGDKGRQVERMFDNIAPVYDAFNHRLSWDIDKRWRRKAIAQLAPYKPQRLLDVATGTGDFAILAARMLHPKEIVGIDISEGMMDVGREKVRQAGLEETIRFEREDCMSLSFDDGSFDAVTSAFGIRNFKELDRGLSEMCRILRRGGHLSIVELCEPQRFPMHQLFKFYSHTIMPAYGKLISNDRKAYQYLTATIEAFPQGEVMVEALHKAGFSRAGFRRLTFGICTMYFATK